MKNIIMGILLTVFTSGFTVNSIASDSEGNYAIWGEGGASCFKYSKARAAEKDLNFKSYLRGYLTSYNTISEDTYSISGEMNLPKMMEWLDNYCDEKAVDSYDRAIQMLITEVENDRYRTPNKNGITEGWGKK
ncbi:MAG: hypothetical protein AB8D52_04860 [Gammaproteobacteria bacterium]